MVGSEPRNCEGLAMRFNKTPMLFVALAASALAGCGDEPEVSSYTTDKPGHVSPQPPGREGMPGNHPPVAQTPGTQNPGVQGPGTGDPAAPPTQLDGLAFAAPDAWRYTGAGQFLMASFQITPATKMTISQARGTLTAQVNRWRGQLGLPGIEGEVDPASLEHIESAAGELLLVDLVSGDGGRRMRIGMMPHASSGQTWFFKLTGSAEDVEANAAAFDAMLEALAPANEEVSDDD